MQMLDPTPPADDDPYLHVDLDELRAARDGLLALAESFRADDRRLRDASDQLGDAWQGSTAAVAHGELVAVHGASRAFERTLIDAADAVQRFVDHVHHYQHEVFGPYRRRLDAWSADDEDQRAAARRECTGPEELDERLSAIDRAGHDRWVRATDDFRAHQQTLVQEARILDGRLADLATTLTAGDDDAEPQRMSATTEG